MASSTREYFEQQFANLDQTRVSTRRLAAIATSALDVRDGAGDIAAKADQNPHLSDVGKRAARLKALEGMFIDIERSRLDVEDIASKTHTAISELALPTLEKGDVVGEMREAEARSIVRAMPQDQRDRLERLPAALATAVVRAPAELSGVSASVHRQLRDELIEAAHPEKLAGLRGDLHGVEIASHVVKEAAAALRAAAKFDPGEERPFLDGIKQKAARKPAPKIDPSLDIDALMAAHRKKHGVA